MLRTLLLASVIAGAMHPLAIRAASNTLPSDAQLEAAGARIGEIEIEARAIFDLSDPQENNWLFRTADRLHVRTRESTIRAQLLFRSGDRYSRRLLDESARNMRQNSNFMREPEIQAVRYHDGLVDIVVITHDVWTVQPQLSFGRSGGTNTTSVELTDDNFLGYGKYVEFGHGENVDRSSNFANWIDPNVWGTHWQDTLQYQNNSDGKVWNLGLFHPFFSLETPYDGGGAAGNARSVVTRYSLGNTYDAYQFDWRVTDVFFGQALLINELWTERLLLGFRQDESVFTPAPARALLAPLPTDRNLAYPYARLQWVRNVFETIHNLDQIAFTEDLHLGLDASVGLGYAAPVFGADRKALLADTEIGYDWLIGPRNYLAMYTRLYTRLEHGRGADAIASGNASYFVTRSDHSKLLVRIWGDSGHNLDLDHYLQIGGDTGLRGYPLRYQNGAARAQFTLEERLYTDWFPFRLIHVGGAVFYDMGRTWGSSPVPTPQLGLLKDLGVGLRLGNARSAFGSVIHIDLATPLDGDRSISKLQFLVSTQQSF